MDDTLRSNTLQAMLVFAGEDGREEALFGDSYGRARQVAGSFIASNASTCIYLEFPLMGDPFLDLTFLYSKMAPGSRVDHPAAAATEPVFDWFADACVEHDNICFGFELDTKEAELAKPAIHFQPREHTQLVRPFFEAVGEPERADLYLDMAERMPKGWALSFFGMFRGRPDAPLRVCGYLDSATREACARDRQGLARVFDRVGFEAYDEKMLEQARAFFAAAPASMDFQFDVYPDGSLGDTFALDVQFGIEQPEDVPESFETGGASRVMRLFEEMGVADGRRSLVPGLAFARGIELPGEDGEAERAGLSLAPRWAKARWRGGVIQPAKLYADACVTVFDTPAT